MVKFKYKITVDGLVARLANAIDLDDFIKFAMSLGVKVEDIKLSIVLVDE